MMILREKGVVLLEFGLDRNFQSGNDIRKSILKSVRVENVDKMFDNKDKKYKEIVEDYIGYKKLMFYKVFSFLQVID